VSDISAGVALHIFAGFVALLSGATAMSSKKGGGLHKKAGLVFVGSMAIMATSGSIMAARLPERLSVIGGTLAVYLILSSLLTVRRPVESSRGMIVGLILFAVGVGAYGMYLGNIALSSLGAKLDGMAAPGYFLFGSIAWASALLDVRTLMAGRIQGVQRLVRHLWRMEFAMFIAAASFFLGQAQVFPEPVRKISLLAIPVVVVIAHGLYWLGRLLLKRKAKPLDPTAPRAAA
jgi:uncharacterized membrane protein